MVQFVTIPGRLVECGDADHWISALSEPGSFLYVDRAHETAQPGEEDRLYFCCPCGCGGHGSTPLRRGVARQRTPEWEWDGNRENPTLSPSVYFEQGREGEWHGFLRSGVWEGC